MDDFLLLDRKTPQSDASASVEDFDVSSDKKAPLTLAYVLLAVEDFKSPELCSLIFRRCRNWLTVPVLHHHSLLAENQMTGVQAIPFKSDTL